MSGFMVAACGGGGGAALAPADPVITVERFLQAVREENLVAMGRLWGSAKGPAANRMNAGELEQRLTVIQIYLDHERFEILPEEPSLVPSRPRERVLRVRLTRRGCRPVVPFTLVRYGDGWLISNIDIATVGNPARRCGPGGRGGR